MLCQQVLTEWKVCQEKINSLSNLRKWIERKLEIEKDYFLNQPELLVDFGYLKKAIGYHKDKHYCPNCSCGCASGPTLEEVD